MTIFQILLLGSSLAMTRMAKWWHLPPMSSTKKTACHILFKCLYSIRIWNMFKDWFGLVDFDTNSCNNFEEVEGWWTTIAFAHGGRRKSIASLLMLVNWERQECSNFQQQEHYAHYYL
jgi:hypothetical protein